VPLARHWVLGRIVGASAGAGTAPAVTWHLPFLRGRPVWSVGPSGSEQGTAVTGCCGLMWVQKRCLLCTHLASRRAAVAEALNATAHLACEKSPRSLHYRSMIASIDLTCNHFLIKLAVTQLPTSALPTSRGRGLAFAGRKLTRAHVDVLSVGAVHEHSSPAGTTEAKAPLLCHALAPAATIMRIRLDCTGWRSLAAR